MKAIAFDNNRAHAVETIGDHQGHRRIFRASVHYAVLPAGEMQ